MISSSQQSTQEMLQPIAASIDFAGYNALPVSPIKVADKERQSFKRFSHQRKREPKSPN